MKNEFRKGAWKKPESDRHKLNPAVELYIACEDLDFSWLPSEIDKVKLYWQQGLSVHVIAKSIERIPEEVAILVMDLVMQGKVHRRPGGALGLNKGAEV